MRERLDSVESLMRHRAAVTALLATLVLALGAVGCGGGANPGTVADIAEGARVDQGGQADGKAGPYIDTKVSTDEAKAGESVYVDCTGKGFDEWGVTIQVAQVQMAGEEGGGADSPAGATDEPPPGVTVGEGKVGFTKVGVYAVACQAGELVDSDPAIVRVVPGDPASIETAVDRHEIEAGQWIEASCQAWDVFGNEAGPEFVVLVEPSDSIVISGLAVQLTKVGQYSVACAVKGSLLQDDTPEKVKVTPNVPKKVYTHVEPTKFQAGGTATVECVTTDYYDNPVADFPVSVYLPPQVELEGEQITSTAVGIYEVKCVPQNIEWKYFQLIPATVTVLPGDPAKLELKSMPDKPFYGVGEKLTVEAGVYDEYGNMVPEAQVVAAKIAPPSGVEPSLEAPNKVFFLQEEGVYTLTFRVIGYPQVSDTLVVKVEGSGPLLTLFYPERGATIDGKPSVTVMGKVSDDVSGIATLQVNGQDVPGIGPDGSFSFIVVPHQGMNLLEVYAENGAGLSMRNVLGFYFSFVYYPVDANAPESGMVHRSARVFLAQEFFDDGQHDPAHPDDLATILENFLQNMNINSLILNPVAKTGPYKVYIQNVTYAKPTLKVELQDGGMKLVVHIPDINMDVKLKGECKVLFVDFCPDFSGTVHVNDVWVSSTMQVWMGQDQKVHAKLISVHASIDGIDVNINGILGSLLDWLMDWLVDKFTGKLEKMVEQQLGNMFMKTVQGLFEKFEVKQVFEIPPFMGTNPASVTVWLRPQEIRLQPEGAYLALEGTIFAPKNVTKDVLGSISRANCLSLQEQPKFQLPKSSEIEFALFDDLLNQALYAVWLSEAIDATITPDEIGNPEELQKYGVSDLTVGLDFYLPPILTDCTDDGNLQLQIGDLYADVDMLLNGAPLHMGVFLEAAAAVELRLEDDGNGHKLVAVTLLGINTFDMQIVSINEEFEGMEEGLVQLVKDVLVPQLDKQIGGKDVLAVPIPVIDLGSLDPNFQGNLELQFDIESLFRDKGFTVATGHLE